MTYEGTLRPRRNGQSLHITWDSETGDFGGADGLEAEQFVAAVREDGYVELAPGVHHHFTGEPLTAAEIGSILNMYWFAGEVFPLLEPDLGVPADTIP